MTTYYIRSHRTGEIVNAVECTTLIQACLFADGLTRSKDEDLGFYADQYPPIETLRRYRYWNERP